MTDAGPALMGIGSGFGKTRARDAALAAVTSPLLDFPIRQARGVVYTITGNSAMSLQEVNEVGAVISTIVSDDANIIFGTSVDESYGDEMSVTIVATSFDVPDGAQPLNQRSAPPPKAMPDIPASPARAPPKGPKGNKPSFWSRF